MKVPKLESAISYLGFARMSMFEVEKASENMCAMRRGLVSKLAAVGRIAPLSVAFVES